MNTYCGQCEIARASVAPSHRVHEFIKQLVPEGKVFEPDSPTPILLWPPDVFAVAASLLRRTGAYVQIATQLPFKFQGENDLRLYDEWNRAVKGVAAEWQRKVGGEPIPRKAPELVEAAWRIIWEYKSENIDNLVHAYDHDHACKSGKRTKAVYECLLFLLAVADEACDGIGIMETSGDLLQRRARKYLLSEHTLCDVVKSVHAVVLPKYHTPKTGITLRSLTHNLALWPGGEAIARWHILPWHLMRRRHELKVSRPRRAAHPAALAMEDKHSLNLLLVPCPFHVDPTRFMITGSRRSPSAGDDYGLFRFDVSAQGSGPMDMAFGSSKKFVEYICAIVINACRRAGAIDMIVFPELSMSEDDFDTLCAMLSQLNPTGAPMALLAGVETSQQRVATGDGQRRLRATNKVKVAYLAAPGLVVNWTQGKHHRWLLDRSQVTQYGLGSQLDVHRQWWEHISIGERIVRFFAVNQWLTFCCLICEDLARQDPVAGLVRSVGPNLLISILMDGPQLKSRWSARYANVLADDPGCSVLSLTSIGMIELSNQQLDERVVARRTIALWEDRDKPREIDLDRDADAVVLSLRSVRRKESTVDMRKDSTPTGYLLFGGSHQIHSRTSAAIVRSQLFRQAMKVGWEGRRAVKPDSDDGVQFSKLAATYIDGQGTAPGQPGAADGGRPARPIRGRGRFQRNAAATEMERTRALDERWKAVLEGWAQHRSSSVARDEVTEDECITGPCKPKYDELGARLLRIGKRSGKTG